MVGLFEVGGSFSSSVEQQSRDMRDVLGEQTVFSHSYLIAAIAWNR